MTAVVLPLWSPFAVICGLCFLPDALAWARNHRKRREPESWSRVTVYARTGQDKDAAA